MASGKKKSILLSFDDSSLHEARKILFQKGISVQEFFAHVIEKLIIQDENLDEYFIEITEQKAEKLQKGDLYKITSDNIYDAIEQNLNKENE